MLTRNPLSFSSSFSLSQYIQCRDDVLLPDKQSLRGQWVVSRSLCLFRCFNLSALPRAKRAAALSVMIRRWSPFQKPDSYIVWRNDNAMVWVWDGAEVQSKIEELGVQAVQILPESVFYSPHSTGAVCFSLKGGGFAGQIWRDDCLLAEKWFKSWPEPDQWRLFVRNLSLPLPLSLTLEEQERFAVVPAGEDDIAFSPLLDTPWGARKPFVALLQGLSWEPYLVAMPALLITVLILWNLTALLLLSEALDGVKKRSLSATSGVEQVLQAREVAVQKKEEALTLLRLLDAPDQRVLLATVGKVLKQNKITLKEWHFNLDKLDIVVMSEKLEALSIVKALEALPDVEAATMGRDRRKNQFAFTLTLKMYHAG